MSPAVLSQASRRVTSTLRLPVTGAGRRVRVRIVPPPFGESAFLRLIGLPEVSGAALLGTSDRSATDLCSTVHNRLHGLDWRLLDADLLIPAGSHAVLTSRFAVTSHAPWPNGSVAPRYEISGPSADAREVAPSVPTRIMPQARYAGHTGVRITVTTSPRTTNHDNRLRSLRRGTLLVVTGRTLPRLPGRYVALRTYAPGHERRLVTVARPRIDSHGRFSARVRLRRAGFYEMWSFVAADLSAKTAEDFACPQAFTVR